MAIPQSNDPGYSQVDPDAAVVAPSRNNSALLWTLLLVALVAMGLWWYSTQPAPVASSPPVATEPPAVEVDASRPAQTPQSAVAKTSAKPAATPKPKPSTGITREPAALASNAQPKYPPQALRSGVEGSVNVRIEVDATGTPTDVRIIERSGERSRDLDRAVTDAARKWRFQPAMENGKPVAGAVVVPVQFKSE